MLVLCSLPGISVVVVVVGSTTASGAGRLKRRAGGGGNITQLATSIIYGKGQNCWSNVENVGNKTVESTSFLDVVIVW